jgi:hypothetical protein
VIENEEDVMNNKASKNKKLVRLRPKCKSITHQSATGKLCALNPKNLAAKEKVYEKAKLREGKCNTCTV